MKWNDITFSYWIGKSNWICSENGAVVIGPISRVNKANWISFQQSENLWKIWNNEIMKLWNYERKSDGCVLHAIGSFKASGLVDAFNFFEDFSLFTFHLTIIR